MADWAERAEVIELLDIDGTARTVVVHPGYIPAVDQEALTQMRAEEAGPTGDQCTPPIRIHWHHTVFT
jgi:hypothetical protein